MLWPVVVVIVPIVPPRKRVDRLCERDAEAEGLRRCRREETAPMSMESVRGGATPSNSSEGIWDEVLESWTGGRSCSLDNVGGISSSIKRNVCSSDILVLGFPTSVLLPTRITQNLSASSSGTGHRSLNSFHHLVSASSVWGWLTSNISITASEPRKKADERLEKRSCPAVSYTMAFNMTTCPHRDRTLRDIPIFVKSPIHYYRQTCHNGGRPLWWSLPQW